MSRSARTFRAASILPSSCITWRGSAASDELSTFSVEFDDPEYDESGAQQAVVQHYGTRHRVARIGTADIAEGFPAAVLHAETALFRSAPVPMMRLSKEVRAAGIKVVMSGEGADEILLGYDLFREAKIRRFWARDPGSRCRGHLLRRLYDYLPQYKNPRYFNLMLDFYRPTLRQVDDPHYAMAVRWANGKALEACFSRDVQELANGNDPVAELERWLPGGYGEADDVERAQAIEAMTLLGNYLLSSQGDRMALANSVEGRYPYLDLEFVRFAARLPRGLKLRGLKDNSSCARLRGPDARSRAQAQEIRLPGAGEEGVLPRREARRVGRRPAGPRTHRG